MAEKGVKTKAMNLTDAAIRRHLVDERLFQLRDLRYPLRLRINKARTGGSWYVVHYSNAKSRWRKVGNWPALPAKNIIDRMPQILSDLAVDPASSLDSDGAFSNVADLMHWHVNRTKSDRNLSKSRQASILSATSKHIIPRVGKLQLDDVIHQNIDELLMWPLQQDYSVSYCRMIFEVMRGAFRNARKLRQIATDPCSGMRFSDFITASAATKQGALRADMISDLAEKLSEHSGAERIFVLLMLCHGTRIGETRKAKWQHFSGLDGNESAAWNIPKTDTKTKSAHRLPITELVKKELLIYMDIQQQSGYSGVYLFPGNRAKAVSGVTANRMIQLVSDRDWTAHDLRKLARTCWADLGIDYMVGEMLLNHALSKLDRTYIHTYVEKQIEEALEKYHAFLNAQGVFNAD